MVPQAERLSKDGGAFWAGVRDKTRLRAVEIECERFRYVTLQILMVLLGAAPVRILCVFDLLMCTESM
jgi:hypothetical protein